MACGMVIGERSNWLLDNQDENFVKKCLHYWQFFVTMKKNRDARLVQESFIVLFLSS